MSYQPINAVEVSADQPQTLRLTWRDGTVSSVDLSAVIARSAHLTPLADADLFGRGQIGAEGFAIEWTDALDLSASQLWRWAQEQTGELMPAEDFREWQAGHKLSLTAAAKVLGLSRRMVQYYATGTKPIPKTVRLACRGATLEMVGDRIEVRPVDRVPEAEASMIAAAVGHGFSGAGKRGVSGQPS